MAKRITPEENVVNFFNNGEVAKVEVVFNIVKSIVKGRLGNSKPVAKKAAPKTKSPVIVPSNAAVVLD